MRKKIKVLNLYAGLGGNRRLWPNDNIEVTAVEFNEEIAQIYQDLFPKDKVIIGDAHQYLLEHYKEFDFIWSSPPCQSHSSFYFNICVRFRGTKLKYPDMSLYEEIIHLQHNFKGLWIVENVNPYYKALIPAKLLQRHLFWSNFDIKDIDIKQEKLRVAQIPDLQKLHGIDLSDYKIKDKRQLLRNCVDSKLANHIFRCGFK